MAAANFRDILAQNEQKTTLVIAIFLAIYVFVGLLVDVILVNGADLFGTIAALITFQIFPTATIILTAVGVVSVMVTFSYYDKIMLMGSEYTLVDPRERELDDEERQLYNIVEELTIASGLGYIPRVYIIEEQFLNAFASGYSEQSAMVAVTRTLMGRLNRAELSAVIAHELSHIKHGDIKLTLVVSVLANVMLFVVNNFVYIFGRSRNSRGSNAAKIILLVFQFVLPLVTLVLSRFLSRSREFMADAGAVEITRDGSAMANALIKIHDDYAVNSYADEGVEVRRAAYISSPFAVQNLLSTHPTLDERLAALGFQR